MAALLFIAIFKQLETGGQILLVVWVIGFPIGVLVTILTMANRDFFLTRIKENSAKYSMKGDAFDNVMICLDKHTLVGSGRDATIIECEEGEEFIASNIFTQLLWDWFRIRYYGIPGIHRIHEFEIQADKLKDPQTIAGEKDYAKFVHHPERPKKDDSLRIRFPRVVVLVDVECKDGVRVKMILMIEFKVIKPYLSIMEWEGDFIPQIERWVTARLLVRMRQILYQDFLEMSKEPGSAFSRKLSRESQGNANILNTYGIDVTQVYVPYADIADRQEDVERAMRAENVAKLNAKAVIAEADGRAQAIERIGNAEASSISARIKAKTGLGVSPDVAAETEALVDGLGQVPNLRTWVAPERGGKTGTNINVGEGGS